MPNGEEGFPKFPTQFLPEDAERIKQLKEQRRALEQAFKVKFSREAWSKISPVERAIRRVTPPWLAPVVEAFPGRAETLEFGFTPEQFQEQSLEIEEEFKELARKQKVTNLLPSIQSDILMSALLGDPILNTSELMSAFPELRTDFNEEEINYLARISQALSRATPEQLLSGELFSSEPSQLPITEEDVESFFPEGRVDPRFILATVAFSKDIEEISMALRQAYPSRVDEREVGGELRQKLLDYFKQRNVELGISIEEGKSTKDAVQEFHQKIADEEGESLVLVNDVGEIFPARKKSDNTVWIEEDLVGYWDEEQNNIVPISMSTGKPLKTEEEQESAIKDLWDSFYFGMQQAWYGTKQGLFSIIPQELLKQTPERGDESDITRALRKWGEEAVAALHVRQDQKELEFQEWMKGHPELTPRPEYTQNPLEHTELFKDPYYYAYTIISNAPIIGAALFVGLATTIATKNPLAGAVAGAAVLTPVQINSVYEDLIANGADRDNAKELGVSVGTLIGAVEIIPGMIVLKAVSPAFMGIFRQNFQKELTSQVVKRLSAKGILLTASKIEVAEVLEEVVQEAMQNAAVKTVNENRSIVEGLDQTAVQTAIAVLPLAAFGGGASYLGMKANLPPEVKKEIDETISEMKEAGLSEEHAEAVAVSQVLETETGQIQVEEAVEKAEEQVPVTSDKITKLEDRLNIYQEEIDLTKTSILVQKGRLAQMKVGGGLPSEQLELVSTIKDLEDRLVDLEKNKKTVLTKTKKARKELIDEPELRPSPLPLDLPEAMAERILSQLKVDERATLVATQEQITPQRLLDELHGHIVRTRASTESTDAEIMEFAQGVRSLAARSDLHTRLVAIEKVIADFKQKVIDKGQLLAAADTELSKIHKISPEAVPEGKPVTPEVTAQAIKHRGTKPEGIAIADALGLQYDGIQKGLGMQFTDVAETGSTFYANTLEQARTNLSNMREAFTKATQELPLETPQAEAIDSTTAPNQIIAPYLVTDPLIRKRRPRTIEWELEQESVESTLGNPDIAKHVKIPKGIKAIRTNAENVLNRLQEEYLVAKKAKDKEAIKVVETRIKNIAKEAGMTKKALLGKKWDNLPPDSKVRLAISLIPDKSLKFHAIREGFDMEYFMEFLEEMTGAPFYSILRRVEAANAATETEKEVILREIATNSDFKHLRTNEGALEVVAQEINARNEIQGVEHPASIAQEGMLLADAIEDIYNSYKPVVRYLRVMRTDSTMEEFKKEFPDAVEAGKELELELAIKLKEEGNLDDLWAFLFALDWGVIEHGFDPRLIASPGLKIRRRGGLKAARGKGRLIQRESIEYPAGKMGMNVLARLGSYIEQMEIQWRIEPEVNTLADYWEMVGEKFEDWGQIERGLETWLERVQNIGLGYNWFDRQVRKLWRQAMVSVFLEPFMSFRNSFQSMLFHPDRTELFRLTLQKLPPSLSEKGTLYYDTFVSQLGGLRRDWLHVGERGFLVPEFWNRLADSLNLYGKSDYYPRLWSFKAALNKAQRATTQYIQDGDVAKWFKNSGAVHLRTIERNYVTSHYLGQLDTTFNLDVPGLHEVSGADMANFYVAQRISDITHFKYRRSSRGLIEMGKTGTTLWNLVVFPRGYTQRLYFQAEKIKSAFSGEATWGEARTGFNDVMKLVVVSLLFDELFKVVSGRRFNPYFALNILFGWQFGGLFVGIAKDLSVTIGDMMVLINPFAEEERKDIAMSRLPTAIERLGDTLVPFYRRAWDIAEASLGREHLDRNLLREVRGLLDKDYTPEELDEIDRNLWEKIRKAVLGGEVQDPAKLKVAMEKIEEAEANLGTIGITGRYYTIGDYGSEIASLTKKIPSILVTEQEGFAPMVLFYKDSEAQWAELYTLPSSKRNAWRKEHILEEAMLLFWERYSSSVFTRGSPEAKEVKSILQMWFDLYGIDRTMHGEWTSWMLPVAIPPPEE